MSIANTTPVTAPVAPSSTSDVYPTHIAEYGKGGYMVVANTAARDAITTERRTYGMKVYDVTTGITYVLGPALTNGSWSVDNRGAQVLDNWAAAAALNATTIPNGTEFHIRAKSTPGDGGQGDYYFDSGSSATPVSGYLIQPSAGSGRFIRKLDNWIDVKRDFGATGDGSTDDTAAIQAAIDNCGDNTVYFPAGTYRVSNLTIKRGITLQGASNWNTILKAKTGATGWMVTASGSNAGSQQNRETNQVAFTLKDIYFDGNSRQASYGCFYLNLIDHVHLENCFIWEFSRSGLFLNQSVRESRFVNLDIRYCGNKDATDNFSAGWPAVSFVDNATSSADAEDAHNGLTFTMCQVVFSMGDGLVIGSRQIHSLRKPSRIVLTNNWFHGWYSGFTTVTYFSTINASATMQAFRLVKVGACYDVVITGNRLSYAGKALPSLTLTRDTYGGSAITGVTYDPENVTCTGNFFNGAWSNPRVAGEIAISAEYGSGNISDNQTYSLFGKNAFGSGWKSTVNRQVISSGLTFDSTIPSTYVGGGMQQLSTSPFTIHVRIRLPESAPSATAGIFGLGTLVGGTSTPGLGCYMSTNGNIYVYLYGSTGSDTRSATIPFAAIENLLGQVVDIVLTRSGTTFKVYINGGELDYTEASAGSAPAWSSSIPTDKWNIGLFITGTGWNSTYHDFRVANRAMAATEIYTLVSAGVKPSDMWGSQTSITAGLLTVGFKYRIVTRASSDFTTVGSANNTVGTEFTATGTGSGLLDASNTVVRLGWIIDPDLDSATGTTVLDRSTNDGDGTLVGSGVRWVKTTGSATATVSLPPLDVPDRGFTWDGVQASSYIGGLSQQLGTDPFSVHVRLRYPSSNPSTAAGIFTLTTATGSIAVGGAGLVLQSTGQLQFQIYGSTVSDFRIASIQASLLTAYAGAPVDIVITRSGTTLAIYVNGTSLAYSESTGGTAPTWAASLTTDRFNIGLFTSSQVWVSTISAFRVANRALSAGEVSKMTSGVLLADVWGSSTVLNSGTLTVGKRYRIVARTVSDFTTAGAASNTVGTEFVATTTGPTLDASNTVQKIGWSLDLDIENGSSATQVADRTTNRLSGTVAGAGVTRVSPVALPIITTATLDFPNTSAQSESSLTVSVPGAALGDVVSLGVPNSATTAGTVFTAWVDSANSVTVRCCNYSAISRDPASGTFTISVSR